MGTLVEAVYRISACQSKLTVVDLGTASQMKGHPVEHRADLICFTPQIDRDTASGLLTHFLFFYMINIFTLNIFLTHAETFNYYQHLINLDD